ncbi:MAG: TetR/AcrR family transcriptional regulator [Fidelibacterota bacterium]
MDKKQQIIHAAIKVFARKGLEKGKIADIAREAGIGKGTVYEYFASKDDLFSAIEQFVIQGMLQDINQLVEIDLPPREKLECIIDRSMEAFLKMGESLLIVTELWAQSARGLWHGSSNMAVRSMYDSYQQIIISILEAGIASGDFRKMDTEGVATLLLAFLDGLIWQYLIMNDPEAFNRVWKEAVKSFFKGIEQ